MGLTLLAVAMIVVLALGYGWYGRFVSRQYRLDDSRVTPAVARNDGVDFVPARPFYLMSQHFAAIAAAGPIAGPILACMSFGWVPCLLWIGLGVIFIGAVHDFSALVVSVRHGAHSVGEMARQNLGRRAGLALLWFIWLALLYVILAFTQITADTFVGRAEEFESLRTTFNKGGAVAMASTLYLGLALLMGLVQRLLRPPMWLSTLIFVPATLGCVWAGTRLDGVLNFGIEVWIVAILAYCLVASMLPLWLLQQPRGYLGGFVLYMALGIGVAGILAGGFEVRQPAFGENVAHLLNPIPILMGQSGAPPVTALLIPFLFVTIACGACSGFHGLICGGTTSRQIARESHCRPVGFGCMLLEGFVAVIALATVMMLSPSEAAGQPPARIYGDGLARFLTVFLGPDAFLFCATFGAMAFSTFVFDTLDVSTRLGRYLLQELFRTSGRLAGLALAGVTVSIPLAFLLLTQPRAYMAYWTLFGTSNQMLAALTLTGVTVWLYRSGRRVWYTLAPAAFVMTITVLALLIQIWTGIRQAASGTLRTPSGELSPAVVNAAVASALLLLAAVFVIEAIQAVRSAKPARGGP